MLHLTEKKYKHSRAKHARQARNYFANRFRTSNIHEWLNKADQRMWVLQPLAGRYVPTWHTDVLLTFDAFRWRESTTPWAWNEWQVDRLGLFPGDVPLMTANDALEVPLDLRHRVRF